MRIADTVTNTDGTQPATDTAQDVRRAGELAGHDHGWLHAEFVTAEFVTAGAGGGLWACRVPKRFHAVACVYRRAFTQGIADFYATNDDMVPPSQIAEAL